MPPPLRVQLDEFLTWVAPYLTPEERAALVEAYLLSTGREKIPAKG